MTYQPISLFKWQIYLAQAQRSKWSVSMYTDGGASEAEDEEQDSLKEMLLETNPYLIATTVIVSVLHSVFELLAFKNGQLNELIFTQSSLQPLLNEFFLFRYSILE